MSDESVIVWQASVMLRYKIIETFGLNNQTSKQLVLQQLWIDNFGNRAWRDVPIED